MLIWECICIAAGKKQVRVEADDTGVASAAANGGGGYEDYGDYDDFM